MGFSFSKIFSQAAGVTKNNKFLWLYGLLLIISAFLHSRSCAGLIIGLGALLEREDTDFTKSFRAARGFSRRIFSIIFFTYASFGVIVAVFVLSQRALSAIVLIPVLALILAIAQASFVFVASFDLKVKDSISAAAVLVAKHWALLMAFSLILLAIISVLPLMLFLFFTFYGNVLWLDILLLAVIAIQSVILVYSQICWFLALQNLIKPVKLEEEDPQTLAEPVS